VLQDDPEPWALGNELGPSPERVRASDEIEDEIALDEPAGERAGGVAVWVEAVEDSDAAQPAEFELCVEVRAEPCAVQGRVDGADAADLEARARGDAVEPAQFIDVALGSDHGGDVDHLRHR